MLVSAIAESCKGRPRKIWGWHAHMMSTNAVQVPPRSYLGPAHAELGYTLVVIAFIVIYTNTQEPSYYYHLVRSYKGLPTDTRCVQNDGLLIRGCRNSNRRM